MNSRASQFGVLGALAFGTSLHGATIVSSVDTFGSGENAFTISFVEVGNPGNADDAGAGGGIYSSPYGGVSYTYRIGMFEISEDAITKAIASGLEGVEAGFRTGNKPATFMMWYEAAAFVNWLNTSKGHQAAYQLDAGNTTLTPWSSAQAWQAGGENLFRHKDAYYFLPNEDEWYKAAFHQNTGVNADYWDYATGSNTIPTQALTGGTAAGSAIFDGAEPGSPEDAVDVNLAGGLSSYGTMGQNGNVFEWQESAFDPDTSEFRAVRGGSHLSGENTLRAAFRSAIDPVGFGGDLGFRVASVPEPSCAMLVLGGGLLGLRWRHR